MRIERFKSDGLQLPLYSVNTLVIGSGAAALKAAVSLVNHGQDDVCIVTDQLGGGTSNNAGSDKQTYYKLSLSGDHPDSPHQMAEDLFNGGCMHGDIALCEAQHSPECFYHLVQIGVPFPHDAFGRYAGYKTDHDLRQRGTSAGPYTSRFMFQALTREAQRLKIPVLDRYEVISLLTARKNDEVSVVGALALNLDELGEKHRGLVVFNAVNVVLGTGGPAGMYRSSVYPVSQSGSTGMAFRIGAEGHNLTESQFGLASVQFRWNLSGSYQQVIPRYFSTDADGGDEREFLNYFFPSMQFLTMAIFLKGYQWPFDPRKMFYYGSSLIDLLVHREIFDKGRRVFLDYTRNPGKIIRQRARYRIHGMDSRTRDPSFKDQDVDFSLDRLPEEAYEYLHKSDALQPTPIERLKAMNRPAYDLYLEHNIDLEREYLEIAVCNQHNNGGLKGNAWWESNIKHLFPVGEVNGTHGINRPGGSALNAGQVGGLRAAMYIAKRYREAPPSANQFLPFVKNQVDKVIRFTEEIIDEQEKGEIIDAAVIEIQNRMSEQAGIIRDPASIDDAVSDAWSLYSRLKSGMKVANALALPKAFKVLDLSLTHAVYLEAVAEYLNRDGRSRGSYMVICPDGDTPVDDLENRYRFDLNLDDSFVENKILEISLKPGNLVTKRWVDIRPIPTEDLWFEKVWKDFREDNVIK